VRFNLTYGATDATSDQISHALRLARVDSYISRLEHGLETAVGERGLRLSGGEKQRLGIASVAGARSVDLCAG
jgi:ABC-type multidrug transport system fused ATPase/permease subunit